MLYFLQVQAFGAVVRGLICGFNLLNSVHGGIREGAIHSHLLLAASQMEGVSEAHKLLASMASYVEEKFSFSKKKLLKQAQTLSPNISTVIKREHRL